MILNNTLKLLLVALACSCSSEDGGFVPKPKGFNEINLPEHKYQLLDEEELPYSFEYSTQAVIEKDTVFEEKKKFYKILKYDDLGCNIHITYKSIKQSIDTLNSLVREGFRLRDGHDKKAYSFAEKYAQNGKGYNVAIFEIEGNVPSQYQFMVHDSVNHFLRGVLYFPIATKNDSLRPVIEFAKEDMRHLINTIRWK